MFTAFNLGILKVSGDFSGCVADAAFLQVFGCQQEDLSRKSLEDLFNPADPRGMNLFNKQMSGYSVGDTIDVFPMELMLAGAAHRCRLRITQDGDGWCVLVENVPDKKNLFHRLQQTELKWRVLILGTSDGIAVLTAQNHVLEFNPAFFEIMKFQTVRKITITENALHMRDIFTLLRADFADDLKEFTLSCINNGTHEAFNANAWLGKKYLNITARPIYSDGEYQGCTLIVKDMTVLVRAEAEMAQRTTALIEEVAERKRAEAELLRFKNILDNTLDMIFMFEPESLRFVYLNQGAVLSMGYSREELLGMTPYQIKPIIPEPKFRQLIAPLLSGEQPSLHFDTVHRRKDGTDFPVAVFLQLVTQSDGSGLFVEIVHDITEKKKSEDIIWQQANFDTLTGLPNRRMFYDRLEQEIKKSHRSGLPMALLLLDLDHFKEVNDALGHAQGDVLLVEAARRIAECVRESDTVARLGGDEFTVILSEMKDVNSVGRIAQKIVERLAAPFQLLQETAYVSASVGITLYPNDALNIEALMKNADQAMYVAKNSGRNRFSYFTAALQEAAQTRMRLVNDLRNALAGEQLAVYYQPIVELASGRIYKAEALLRWQHPKLGMVSPMQFIPLAEESGLIHEIGDWVFHEATRELKRWRERFVPEFQISVNVSPVQFRKNVVDDESSWLSHLHAMDLPRQSLAIEITEGLLLNAELNVTEKLLSFRDAGVQVALDDFGTGYSSLSYLKKFDIDYLKIDQSFVRNLEEDLNNRALCEAIIVMAHKLGLKVIAEGVETEQQRDLLASYGCDYAQGWLYSKAVPSEQFEALLRGQVM